MSFFPWWTFWFYIWNNVHRTQSVRIFENTVREHSSFFTAFSPSVISKTCLLIPEYGPCRGRIRMWYFNPQEKNCSQFRWGGCQGNGNRFDTFDQCWNSCMSKPGARKYIPRYCSLTFDYGFCFGAVERYYYDNLWKVCKTTLYSGCGGNKNNFYNQHQCENICRFGTGSLTTPRQAKGGAKKVVVINPWNTTPKRTGSQPANPGNASAPDAAPPAGK